MNTLTNLYPSMPLEHSEVITNDLSNHSSIENAVRSYVKYEMTRFNNLREQGYSREEANEAVSAKVESILNSWK